VGEGWRRGERGGTVGVTGVCRGSRAVREARGDSLGAPRPSIVPDLAPPHGALVGGHDRTRALVPCGYAARCEWPAPSLPKCEGSLAKLETRPNCLRVRCAGKLENYQRLVHNSAVQTVRSLMSYFC
jgi:hypothetical protein